ncbi:aryl-alcohol dehydrogenase-like predicted oxidoreductase [Amaricoccus macauensis]|uniref:Aryl-alcohol dehydrogenase-like predicted oxidoreductase n=1 Tax=Amaricoccus macauensis TaxID=57001 RepID=A0A840SGK4_9RHOB|nr:aldo/keto reductase [Amaricoccus macauensis]MBB5222109.1 aryl-alcohol dehydrogenase-like predicted oxidoreductase [Amaricoccus macauensis]
MDYRYLGRSGLRVSVLTMGTMTFGAAGSFTKVGGADLREAQRQVSLCLDAGVNLFDTANVYSSGNSEEFLGRALGKRRQDVLVASKVRFRMGDGPNGEGLSRYAILREVEASLKRLGTDVIDILYLHEWDGMTPLDETLGALDTLIAQGKIRYAGASNYSAWHLMKALGVAEARALPRLVTQQIHYTLEAREAEYELVPIAVAEGVGILVWSPLAGGLLSGKYGPETPSARQVAGWREPPIRDVPRLWRIVEALREVGGAHGVSAAQVALAWLLGRPGVTSLVVGGRNEEQFRDSLAAVDLVLTSEERDRLDAVSAPPVIYPYWHQNWTARGRFGPADFTAEPSGG